MTDCLSIDDAGKLFLSYVIGREVLWKSYKIEPDQLVVTLEKENYTRDGDHVFNVQLVSDMILNECWRLERGVGLADILTYSDGKPGLFIARGTVNVTTGEIRII